MELIRNVIEWIGTELGTTLATLFPFMLLGLLGLYVLWLVVGYLRVSQIGLGEGRGVQHAVPLPSAAGSVERPRGVPYCSFDGLAFPIGARFCTSCERDLFIDCATCGATVSAADASCYRCGTPTGAVADVALLD
jgi:double zinc ribbon protein